MALQVATLFGAAMALGGALMLGLGIRHVWRASKVLRAPGPDEADAADASIVRLRGTVAEHGEELVEAPFSGTEVVVERHVVEERQLNPSVPVLPWDVVLEEGTASAPFDLRTAETTATVDGRPFEEFLTGTIQYRFVSWLVEVLLYEIRETGTETGLRALYDVLPEVDRAEFNGTVTSTDEEGETHAEAFDVVCRNRMGKPLIVANINDSLDPATGDMMGTLVEDATDVAESHESIGAAFLVTASFFQPDALETADAATRGGGFLSRDSKKSFVKLSRSGGYHLCLVEARGDDFHVAVPEF